MKKRNKVKKKTSLKKKKTISNLMLSHLTSLHESNTVDAESSFLTTARMMDMSLLKILIIFPSLKIAEKESCVMMSF